MKFKDVLNEMLDKDGNYFDPFALFDNNTEVKKRIKYLADDDKQAVEKLIKRRNEVVKEILHYEKSIKDLESRPVKQTTQKYDRYDKLDGEHIGKGSVYSYNVSRRNKTLDWYYKEKQDLDQEIKTINKDIMFIIRNNYKLK